MNYPGIEVRLGVEALDHVSLDDGAHIVRYDGEDAELLIYTGAIDELFSCKYGSLPYRSLNITYEYFDEESVLPCEIVSFPQAPGYTRKTEYKQQKAWQHMLSMRTR